MSGAIDPVIWTSATKNTCWYGAPSKVIPLSSRTVLRAPSHPASQGTLTSLFEPSGLLSVAIDRKSTRLNSSHTVISYAVFCLKKKKKQQHQHQRPEHGTRPGQHEQGNHDTPR